MKKAMIALSMLLVTSVAKAEVGDILVRYNSEGIRTHEMAELMVSEQIAYDLDIFLYKPKYRVLDTNKILSELRQRSNIKWAQLDHPVQMRDTQPNDPDFSKQWSLKSNPNADIAATTAWDLGQGGKSVDGADIVMAVVDQGVEVTHPSLVENMWVNQGEIAGNGIDDDNNGYVDDINGWNALNDSGVIPAGYHATHVAGIMGAKGNDGSQVAGINWDAKIMSVAVLGSGGGSLTSRVLKAYGYILNQKQLWLDSQGAKGANVVVTNSSFGVDRGDCTSGDYPAWDDIYNEMGAVGILSAAATANAGWDIDKTGDVPTGCSSDFLITVTNTNSSGMKSSSAGYGAKTIDIGAPGTAILSLYTGGSTASLTGTSMATPHVAGAVGFLYSVASEQFNKDASVDPAGAALYIKDAIMNFGSDQSDLKGKTVSGKRLNLANSATALATY